MKKSPKKVQRPSEPLSVEAWCKFALNYIIRHGVKAVAVEPLTRELGVTKGSFYWHFSNRDALVEETLRLWAEEQTRDFVLRWAGIPDIRTRLRLLMFAAFEDTETGLFFAALSASSEDPLVQPHLAKVSKQRLDFVTQSFLEMGLDMAEAQRRSLFAYSTYVGYFHLLRAIPEATRAVSDLSAYVHYLADTLVPKQEAKAPRQGHRS